MVFFILISMLKFTIPIVAQSYGNDFWKGYWYFGRFLSINNNLKIQPYSGSIQSERIMFEKKLESTQAEKAVTQV